jgi:hypothetical protein
MNIRTQKFVTALVAHGKTTVFSSASYCRPSRVTSHAPKKHFPKKYFNAMHMN